MSNTQEAEFIIRMGDVDNLGFGWPQGFDPFCSRMTESHSYPWDINPLDLQGFDRILLSSKFNPAKTQDCGSDGYSASFNEIKYKPVTWKIPTEVLKGVTIKNIYLQIFIDDFQAPSLCSKFRLLINGKRFVEGEKLLNAIDQTGPVGKLISIPLTADFYPLLSNSGNINLLIDESTGAADGFAVDFVRLLVNRKLENSCMGNIRGKVWEKDSENPVAGAKIFTADNRSVETNSNGEFELRDIPAGFEVLRASAAGYTDGSGTADIGQGEDNPEVMIYLEKGKSAEFNKKRINAGETITLNNILFDQGKAVIRNDSKPELEKLVSFLLENPGAEIELSGHTSSEGEREYNRSLSYKRVKACKDYIVARGIAEDRVIAIGFGPDHPVAPNDTETNRTKNRRVEMRLKKL
ncbi:MAG: OmpA family protein [Chitinophagaceae bacterium]|nr:OmpA family protein [Chitinophagaceae bacterium]